MMSDQSKRIRNILGEFNDDNHRRGATMTTPNTLLAAARLAYPDLEWYLQENGCVYSKCEDDGVGFIEFELTDAAHSYALWLSLAENGVSITGPRSNLNEKWCAHKYGWRKAIFRDSDTDAMLSAVETLEAMK